MFVGFFEYTIPKFLNVENQNCAFVHIDSDLYSSAKTVLTLLKNRIVTGTIIAFDDFHNWKCCLDGEFKALLESDLEYSYIAHTGSVQGAIIIK